MSNAAVFKSNQTKTQDSSNQQCLHPAWYSGTGKEWEKMTTTSDDTSKTFLMCLEL
jgi:hypothetical protein